MCQHFNWDKEDEDREEAHKAFKDALTQQFNDYYGTDVDNIASWQKLCRRLGVEPIPEGLQACRAVRELLDRHIYRETDIPLDGRTSPRQPR